MARQSKKAEREEAELSQVAKSVLAMPVKSRDESKVGKSKPGAVRAKPAPAKRRAK